MLQKIKKQLTSEKENLLKQLESYKNEDPLRDPEQSLSHTVDDAITVSEGHDRIAATRAELKMRLVEVEMTLVKIDGGKYGLCEKCGEKISTQRLAAIKTARLCLKCAGKGR